VINRDNEDGESEANNPGDGDSDGADDNDDGDDGDEDNDEDEEEEDEDDDENDGSVKATVRKPTRRRNRASIRLAKQATRRKSAGSKGSKHVSKDKYVRLLLFFRLAILTHQTKVPPCDRCVADKQECLKPTDSRDGARRSVRRACLYCRKRNQACSKANKRAETPRSDTGTPEVIKPTSNSPRKRPRQTAPPSSRPDANPARGRNTRKTASTSKYLSRTTRGKC